MNKRRIQHLQRMLPKPSGPVNLFKVPGRINLIGEHTDYNNCPVFPLASDKEILALVTPRNDRMIRVRDVHPEFGEVQFSVEQTIEPYPSGSWGNYIKAGVQELLLSRNDLPDDLFGFEMVIDSNIPPAAGMSSSSAMVVLSALAFLRVQGISADTREQRLDLADACARGERYTGTQGGGMDQAAILLGKAGNALKIDFNPLSCITAPLPESHCIVAAHSTVNAPKTQSVMDAYNRRSIECRLAAALLSHRAKKEYGVEGITCIGDMKPEKTGLTQRQISSLVESIAKKPYTAAAIASEMEIPTNEVHQRWCLRRDKTIFGEPEEGFELYKRLTHVWTEWERVEKTYAALTAGDIALVGDLMNQSHGSCRDLHEISCPELDILTGISRKAGAEGSRLTGAGFGGCTVSLVRKEHLRDYLEEVGNRFYRGIMGLDSWEHHLFSVIPSDGAGEVSLSG